MRAFSRILLIIFVLHASLGTAQTANRSAIPHIGYLLPAGAQQGARLEVLAWGQSLRGAKSVHVSGTGVTARVVKEYRPVINLQPEQRAELMQKIGQVRDKRLQEMVQLGKITPAMKEMITRAINTNVSKRQVARKEEPKKPEATVTPGNAAQKKNANSGNPIPANATATKNTKQNSPAAQGLPDSPLWRNLENMSLRELQNLMFEMTASIKKKQQDTQLAESVLLEVTIAPNADPGDYELRLQGAGGLSNPMCFQIGQLPETHEMEPNQPDETPRLMRDAPMELPLTINGHITPGDIDRFHFNAKKGQNLVIEAQARNLIPFLADAVPGWFQATLTLYDANGKELAYDDDYRFDPDPVLFFKVPADGEYAVEVRDALYRGRNDFVYRLSLSERPFVTQMFPLGGQIGTDVQAEVAGWNLTKVKVPLDTRNANLGIHESYLHLGNYLSNPLQIDVSDLPELLEKEPNDSIAQAESILMPRMINGRILKSGDQDYYKIQGKAGQAIVAEVRARKLHSPMDSLLRLMDANGKIIAWNDDQDEKEDGFLTHHADSYLRAKLPADGTYFIQISDSQNAGGEAWAYRLRLSDPRPDFVLCAAPSSITIPPTGTTPIAVHVFRKDGFKGPIDVSIDGNSNGFTLSGTRIPDGQESVRITLTGQTASQFVPLHLKGSAIINGKNVTHPACATEDEMQAFLPRHLVPMKEMLVSSMIQKGRSAPPMLRSNSTSVRLAAAGVTDVHIPLMMPRMMNTLEWDLNDPPKGIALQEARNSPNGIDLRVKTDGTVKPGYGENLIVEGFMTDATAKKKNPAATTTRRSIGVLPAIPFTIAQK